MTLWVGGCLDSWIISRVACIGLRWIGFSGVAQRCCAELIVADGHSVGSWWTSRSGLGRWRGCIMVGLGVDVEGRSIRLGDAASGGGGRHLRLGVDGGWAVRSGRDEVRCLVDLQSRDAVSGVHAGGWRFTRSGMHCLQLASKLASPSRIFIESMWPWRT